MGKQNTGLEQPIRTKHNEREPITGIYEGKGNMKKTGTETKLQNKI